MTEWLAAWWWQGLALTLATAAALKMMPRLNAATRHAVWVAVCCGVAWLGAATSPYSNGTVTDLPAASGAISIEPMFEMSAAPAGLISVLLGVWMAVALLKWMRALSGLHTIHTLRDRCRPFPRSVEAKLPLWLEAKRHGRETQLLVCDAVRSAAMLGFHRPCIVVPSSLIAALTHDDLDQIVLHEYAHAQRRDDWLRLGQALLMPVMWMHPAAAIIGRRIDVEREIACDEWVIARTGLPKAYAQCLTRAAGVRGRIAVEPMFATPLFGARGDLRHRIERLLAIKGPARCQVSVFAVAAVSVALMQVSMQIATIPLVGVRTGATGAAGATGLPSGLPTEAHSAKVEARSAKEGASDTSGLPRRLVAPKRSDIVRKGGSDLQTSAEAGAGGALGAAAEFSADPPAIPPEIAVLRARSIDVQYQTPLPNAVERTAGRDPLRRAGAVGVAIGSAAQNAGVGIGAAFTRAGVSLARKF